MPLVAVSRVPIVITSGPLVGVAALIVAAVTGVALAYLLDTGRSTIWGAGGGTYRDRQLEIGRRFRRQR